MARASGLSFSYKSPDKVDNFPSKSEYLISISLGEDMKLILILMMVLPQVQAATIAVIDSGVDVEHKDFHNKIWMNENEVADNGRDEDGNGYQDDVYGWNFAENNNKVIDRSYLGTFSKDPYKFFEIQARMFMGESTEADRKWLDLKREDPNFMKELQKFGNFVHGTHVAGITLNKNDEGKVLSVKLIPTEIKPATRTARRMMDVDPSLREASDDIRMQLLKAALDKLSEQQMNMLEEIAYYVSEHKAQVANGSFGTGYGQAKMITDTLFKIFFFRSPSNEESKEMAIYFISRLVAHGEDMVASAPNTLFVFAAGNDGSNNDEYPTSPTNIEADNVISVAATYKYNFLAPFSNYGIKKVDVAAPGMLIDSQIPGDERLLVSGTSQAAPFVANIAAKVMDINPELKPVDVKKIILGTIDAKDFLKGKVKTEGIVNPKRAEVAAQNTLTMTVEEAIKVSMAEVEDVQTTLKDGFILDANAVTPIALPSMFR